MKTLRRTTAAAVLVLTASFALVGCSGDDEPSGNPSANTDGDDEVSPEEALAFAKSKLDETTGVRLTLSTDDDPDSEAFLSEASGVITADPAAFDGKASGTFEGIPASDVDIVSVGGTVYAKFLGSFQDFDLPDCVPDPAGLLDPTSGFATVLTDAQQVEAGEQVRGGADNDEILTPYTAVVPGDSVQNLLPCAPGDEFVATFTLDDDGALRTADLTGEFFADTGEITYSIAIDDYDVDEEITKP
ncbi:LppX_LprAFG lipoprotein [Nocardioides sp.]|uniref:LppX_LprAFG lipoprotein n=1 Tax=Nocardioides sp. TaxID=35761 RepID=UPI00271EE584|nr:LppX_LprAFG lipoprotein [Nocardioides sp.]MDO9456047.1 LppX_LprAFG lipoprotein [Nocardioides sp.]